MLREYTLKEKALYTVATKISGLKDEKRTEIEEHEYRLKRIAWKEANFHAAMQILNGEIGYVRMSQHSLNQPESGFTAFEEVVNLIGGFMFDVSLERLDPYLGTMVFKIDEKGMMTRIGHKWDESD